MKPVLQKSPPIISITSEAHDREGLALESLQPSPEHTASVWVSRLTSIVGGVCLILALTLWLVRPDHYRPVLLLLTVAMFAAILHSYTFENGSRG